MPSMRSIPTARSAVRLTSSRAPTSTRCIRLTSSRKRSQPAGDRSRTATTLSSGGPQGEWKVFPSGALKNARGGTVTLKVTDAPVSTRYVRILMTESSNTCDEHGPDDVRNCVGYAIQHIATGTLDASGAFLEVPKYPSERPTTYCVSSIDPWHSEEDVNDGGSYQHSGFDLFFTSGLTNNLPAMIPVTMLYGTPDDAAAQIPYFERRG